MQADLRLGQIRSGQMKKDPPRSESDPLKVHISEIITALIATPALVGLNWPGVTGHATVELQWRVIRQTG